MFVTVAGPQDRERAPVAASLARALGLPLIPKDAIREALMDVLRPPTSVDQSRELGRASVMAMLTVAETSPTAVLDSTWYPSTVSHLRQLRPSLIEIRRVCPREIVQARYEVRSKSPSAGRFDDQRSPGGPTRPSGSSQPAIRG